jgi:hypothetical protein
LAAGRAKGRAVDLSCAVGDKGSDAVAGKGEVEAGEDVLEATMVEESGLGGGAGEGRGRKAEVRLEGHRILAPFCCERERTRESVRASR